MMVFVFLYGQFSLNFIISKIKLIKFYQNMALSIFYILNYLST